MKFKALTDKATGEVTKVKPEVNIVNGILEIQLSGYGENQTENGYGVPIMVSVFDGHLRVHVWADINQEDYTHNIDLEGAKETARKEL